LSFYTRNDQAFGDIIELEVIVRGAPTEEDELSVYADAVI
jgi:hypothetical protein